MPKNHAVTGEPSQLLLRQVFVDFELMMLGGSSRHGTIK